jgi:hypothetical protein
MRIRLNKAIAEFIPENPIETAELESLWIRMGNCVGNTKQLEPMGVYEPSESNIARFHINGLTEQEANAVPVFKAPYDTDVYCATCNKKVFVKKGDQIPICCGKLMEIID